MKRNNFLQKLNFLKQTLAQAEHLISYCYEHKAETKIPYRVTHITIVRGNVIITQQLQNETQK